ncbi:MAG: DEAD/DEAH box helicase [Spirochaetia bacterium]|jgi:superfamily II DNA/RNA helicase|nr:DEAD/DEAH box helicase [Spirochaetia bacterium]
MSDFSSLNLDAPVAAALGRLGFSSPTQIQRLAIPKALNKRDLFLQSETGTGKTLAYLAPGVSAIHSLDPGRGPLLLVLCPTQELCVQVAHQAELLCEAADLRLGVVSLLGGSPLSRQESALKKKPHIVVGTPGRTADLGRAGMLRLDRLEYLVLDEGDRLFSGEYREQSLWIIGKSSPRACKILASATISTSTKRQALSFMKDPISIDLKDEGVLSRDIEHWVFYVEHRKRLDFLRKLDRVLKPEKCLVFAGAGERVKRAEDRLKTSGALVESILAREEKEQRRVAIERFQQGSLRYLVTTDLSARGLDIPGISHVISLDFPEESSWYVHRAGRTGRAGKPGISIVLADALDLRRASKLAVDRGFVFRTKSLEEGQILEPPVEEFFQRVEAGEEEKRAYRKSRS